MNEREEPEKADEEGMSLPTVTGAIVAASNSKPIQALLGPAASALGQYWGRRTEEWAARQEERRRKNIEGHVQHVDAVEHLRISENATEKQFQNFAKWADEAKTVDPEQDSELAALWQSLLASVLKNDIDADDMLDTLKRMNPADARVVLEIGRYWTPAERLDAHRVKKLIELGVVETYAFRRDRRLVFALAISGMTGALIAGVSVIYSGGYISLDILGVPSRILQSFLTMTLILIIFFMLLSWYLRFSQIRLTRLGSKLSILGRKYYCKIDS